MIRLTLLAIALAISSPALAAPLTWRIEGTGTGTLDGAAFDGAYVFILKGDTANFTAGGDLNQISPLDSARIRVAGHGTAAFGQMRLGFNSGLKSIFLAPQDDDGDILDFYVENPVNLKRSFSPVFGEVFELPWTFDVETSLGALRLNSSSEVSFSAVPLPPAALLLLGALAAGGLVARRKGQRATA